MPNFEEHCESTLKKLGCRFERVHKWMDSPSGYMGTRHRLRRHDPYKTPEIAKELFSKTYPNHAHLIEEAVLDHIELDRNSGDFAYSETDKVLRDLVEEEREEAWKKSIRKESRLKALKGTPKWLGLSIASIIALYFSYQSDPTNSSPLIAISFLASVFFLWITFEHIGEYLGFHPFIFSFLTLIEIGVVIFFVLFGEWNQITLLIVGTFTGFYLLITVAAVVDRRVLERDTERLRAKTRKMLEERRRIEIEKPEVEKEELDFLSEENLEAQGIPSSAVMDMEDEEE